jgi:hypothetical protein
MAFALRQSRAATNRPTRSAAPAARAGAAAGSLMLGIARVVRALTWIVVAVIVAAILLRVLDANASNTIVRDIHDAGAWLVGPFKNLFSVSGPKKAIAINWGIAAVVYLVVGSFIARLLARAALR